MKGVAIKFTLAAALLFTSGAALAADEEAKVAEAPEIVQGLFACREIEDPTERLACFDREVAVVYEARESEELVIADKEQVREARKGLFGFSLPKLGLFSGKQENDVNEIETTLTSIRKMGNGKLTFTVDGGGRWQQLDNIKVLGKPGPGDPVLIKKGAIGSYLANINGRRAIRVKRVD